MPLRDTHARTLFKSITYRALAIGASIIMVGWYHAIYVEISKTIIFYLCERFWLRVHWEIKDNSESWTRTIVKSLFYRLLATVVAAYWVGIQSALWLALFQTILFILNEKAWQLVSWGRCQNLN